MASLYTGDDYDEDDVLATGPLCRLSATSVTNASERLSLGEDDGATASASRVSITSSISTPDTIKQFASVSRAIGYLYQFMARYTDAIHSYQVALISYIEYHPEKDDVEVASTLQQLGHVFTSNGEGSRAIRHYKRALEMQRRLFGDGDHPTIASCLHRLATQLEQTGDVQDSLHHYTQSLEMKRRMHGAGKDHKEIASTLHRIGNLLQRMDQHQDALAHYRQSIEMLTRIHGVGVDHAGLAYSLHDSGEVLEQVGDLPGATASYEKALAMRARIYGDKAHKATAQSAVCAGRVLRQTGRLEASALRYQTALELNQRLYDRGVPDYQASPAGDEALATRYDHAEVLASHAALAGVLRQLGKSDEAQQHRDAAASMAQRMEPAQVQSVEVGEELGLVRAGEADAHEDGAAPAAGWATDPMGTRMPREWAATGNPAARRGSTISTLSTASDRPPDWPSEFEFACAGRRVSVMSTGSHVVPGPNQTYL